MSHQHEHLHTHTHGHGHGHDHDHAHTHGHGHDFTSSNRDFFNKFAAEYDAKPLIGEVTKKIASAFLREYAFDEQTTRVLDFACGTGLVSRELAPHAKQIVGVDISTGMVEQYNLRVANQGIPASEMRALVLDLLKTYETLVEGSGTEFGEDVLVELGGKFDVIVSSAAFHHLPSVPLATRALASLLVPGGKLLVADIAKESDNDTKAEAESDAAIETLTSPTPNPFSPAAFMNANAIAEFKHEDVVPHVHGLDEAELRESFERAGLRDVEVRRRVRVRGSAPGGKKVGEEEVQVQVREILIASGVKA